MAAAAKKKSTTIAQGLVPPPPPIVPTLSPGQYQQMTPIMDTSQPAPTPQVSMPSFDLSAPNTAAMFTSQPDLTGLNNLRSAFGTELAAAQKRRDAASTFMSGMEQPVQTEFDQQLLNGVKQDIVNNLASRNSQGAKFGRGFEAGQQLAANLLLPAIGLFGGPGTAFGALQATEQLNKNVKESRAQRAAEESARNQSLINMSNLFDRLDPQSASNVLRRVQSQIELAKLRESLANTATSTITDILGKQSSLEQQALESGVRRQGQLANAVSQDFNNQLALAQLNRSVANDKRSADQFGMDYALRQSNNAQGERRLSLEEQQATANNKYRDQDLALKQQGLQQAAILGMIPQIRQIDTAAAKGPLGDYPGLKEAIASDQLAAQLFNKLGATAGIQGAGALLKPPAQPAQQTQDQGWGNWLGGIGQALSGASGAKPVGLSPEHRAALNNEKTKGAALETLVPQVTQQLQQRGIKPTPEAILKEIKRMQAVREDH